MRTPEKIAARDIVSILGGSTFSEAGQWETKAERLILRALKREKADARRAALEAAIEVADSQAAGLEKNATTDPPDTRAAWSFMATGAKTVAAYIRAALLDEAGRAT